MVADAYFQAHSICRAQHLESETTIYHWLADALVIERWIMS